MVIKAYDRFTTNKHIISRFSIHIAVNVYRLYQFTIHIISAAYLISLLSWLIIICHYILCVAQPFVSGYQLSAKIDLL